MENMTPQDWKELGLQCLMGGIYGAAGAIATSQDFGTGVLMIVLTAAVKGAAHTAIRLLKPRLVAQGAQFRNYHWTERVERWL